MDIPASVTEIGDWAFRGCTSLESVTIPTSVTKIGNRTFYDCTSLASMEIPTSVTEIGEDAFAYCSQLEEVKYLGTKAQWRNITKGDEWYKIFARKVICKDGEADLD